MFGNKKHGGNLAENGFSLIEVLVVISIIAVLASVVLPRFNVARGKAIDANIKSNMSLLTEAGELYYDNADTYAGFCASSDAVRSLEAAATKSVNNPNTYECNDSVNAWGAAVPLQVQDQVNGSSGTDFWCVETRTSPGLLDATTTLAAGGYTCD